MTQCTMRQRTWQWCVLQICSARIRQGLLALERIQCMRHDCDVYYRSVRRESFRGSWPLKEWSAPRHAVVLLVMYRQVISLSKRCFPSVYRQRFWLSKSCIYVHVRREFIDTLDVSGACMILSFSASNAIFTCSCRSKTTKQFQITKTAHFYKLL